MTHGHSQTGQLFPVADLEHNYPTAGVSSLSGCINDVTSISQNDYENPCSETVTISIRVYAQSVLCKVWIHVALANYLFETTTRFVKEHTY